MHDPQLSEITLLLQDWNSGEESARDRLLPFVYSEMRRQARSLMQRERQDHTLQPTEVVHEAFIRLQEMTGIQWRDRSHFYGFASRIMRQVLVDHARKMATSKRGSRPIVFSIDDVQVPIEERADAIVALHEALERLAVIDPRQASVVEMRFFGGLSSAEAAEVLGVSERTVSREWESAKLWLFRELRGDEK